MRFIPSKLVTVLAALALFIGIANPVDAALPDTIFQVEGTNLVVADLAGGYAGDLGTGTDQIDISFIQAGSAQQSDKLDLDTNRARIWQMYAGVVFDAAPVSGEQIDFYLGFSPSCTAGTANPGGTSGADSNYTGTAGDSLDDSIKQLTYIGSLHATSDGSAVVQFQHIGFFKASERCANLVIDNNTSQATDGVADEQGVQITPLEDRIID